jgi:hypothetical protein
MLNESEILIELDKQCDAAGSQRAWAHRHGFSESYVSLVRSGQKPLTTAIANALGYFMQVRFFPAVKGNAA